MRTRLFVLVLGALICVPTVGVSAGVGNGQSDVPPGLIQAQERTLAAIERQMEKEEQQSAKKLARLDLLLQEALWAGDFDAADEIQEEINKEVLRHERRMQQLQEKQGEKHEKFLQKMDDFRNRSGDEEEPPPIIH